MITPHHTLRRADRGTLIVRASLVAVGIAASVGLQLSDFHGPSGRASLMASDRASLLCADVGVSSAFL